MERHTLLAHIGNATHFGSRQLKTFFPSLTSQHLTYRQHSGKILQIKRGRYEIAGRVTSREDRREIANHIYEPSYISLESALSYYSLIPEAVFSHTSITTKKTTTFQGNRSSGGYIYTHIAPHYFWGYQIVPYQKDRYLYIATPEKCVLDYLYIHHEMNNTDAFDERRINTDQIQQIIDRNRYDEYLHRFNKKTLTTRANLFKQYLRDNTTKG